MTVREASIDMKVLPIAREGGVRTLTLDIIVENVAKGFCRALSS